MRRYDATVPVRDATDTKRFRQVGVVLENRSPATGETYLRVQLEFPMWVSELVCFPSQLDANAAPADAAAKTE